MEIVVADNGSSDHSADVVAPYSVLWEALGQNHGFARGNNIAAGCARGDILVFVNNDMRFAPEFVEELVVPLIANGDVFATDARQFDWDGRKEIHRATRLRPQPLRRALRGGTPLPLVTIDQVHADHVTPVVQACAGNMAVRRSMFEELGGFDERLPAGWEDTEICWRAWLRGWKTVFVPSALVWHRVGVASSTQEGAAVRFRGSVGGRLVFATKHLPVEHTLLIWAMTLAGAARELVAWRSDLARARFGVLREFAKHVPALLMERRSTYRTAMSSPRRHLQRLMAIGPPTTTPATMGGWSRHPEWR